MGQRKASRIAVLLAATALCPSIAAAQSTSIAQPARDTILVANAPEWVIPVTATAAEGDGGITSRLTDVQVHYGPGTMTYFQHQVLKFNAAAALQQATNIIIQWQPEFGNATVHTARIVRDGTVIDLLAKGKFETIRQEARLANAMIDGTVTAIMPIADLRVGDTLDFSYTVSQSNPALGGHVEFDYMLIPGNRTDQFALRQVWPKGAALRTTIGAALPAARTEARGGLVISTIASAPMSTPKMPGAVPPRIYDRNMVLTSDFASWNQVSATLAPAFDKASVLAAGSPIRAEIDRIAKLSADPLVRAREALRLVQKDVRYFADVKGLGGYVPDSADKVWERRIGDCKGKTVLLIAMLRELGIEAVPAVVSTVRGDGIDSALPMASRFDHVIVRSRIGGQTYWLDGTRQDARDLARLDPPDYRWALPLVAAGGSLEAMPNLALREPERRVDVTYDLTAGHKLPAKASGTVWFGGDYGQGMAMGVDALDSARRDEVIKQLLTSTIDGLIVDKITTVTNAGGLQIDFTGKRTFDWDDQGSRPRMRYFVSSATLGTTLGPSDKEPPTFDAPIEVARRHVVSKETILLPANGAGFSLSGLDIDQTVGGIRYLRKASLKGNRFEVTSTQTSLRSELSLAQAKAADEAVKKISDNDLYLLLPFNTPRGKPAQAATLTIDPETPFNKAASQIERGKYEAALATIDPALAKAPKDSQLLALRGHASYLLGRLDQARASLDAALAADAYQATALRVRARMLSDAGQTDDALLVLDRAVTAYPESERFYFDRAEVAARAGLNERALADLRIAYDKMPNEPMVANWLCNALIQAGKGAEALILAQEFMADHGNSPQARAVLAQTQVALGKRDDAHATLAGPVDSEADLVLLITRQRLGLAANLDEMQRDLLDTIRVAPGMTLDQTSLRAVAADPQRKAKLLAALNAVPKVGPPKGSATFEIPPVTLNRAMLEYESGNPAALRKAVADLERMAPKDWLTLNNLCWARATRGFDLDAARKTCEAAVALTDEAGVVDSLALLELQAGNNARALALYERASRRFTDQPETTYGRGLARIRMGQRAAGEADLAYARTLDISIDRKFKAFGLIP